MVGDERFTPDDLFKKLNRAFNFTLDAAASDGNSKCNRYYTKENSGLLHSWNGETVWLNPPYSAQTKTNPGIIGWVRKSIMEGRLGTTVVMLIPADTSTMYFEECFRHATSISFLTPRVKFGNAAQGAKFGSLVVVFDQFRSSSGIWNFCRWNWKTSEFEERTFA